MKRVLLLVAVFGVLANTAPANDAAIAAFDFREVIRSAKDEVFPAVVYIKCVQESHERGERISQEVSGSGVIISPGGEVITNWHVVDKATEIRCLLFDGRPMDARIVGTDRNTDLALLRLSLPPDSPPLPHARIGTSDDLTEGDFVMAMGAPWGMSRSVSIGIISCSKRYLPGHSEYSLWLQTDCSISPGNSGGPLVNTAGEVVGINSLGIMWGGDMGFALPSETIAILLPQLRNNGRVDWSWTGLQLQPLNDFNRNIYFGGSEGVIVAETDPESPARRAGILARDRILSVNDVPVNALTYEDLPQVRRLIGLTPKYDAAKFVILRDDELVTVELTPREKGDVEGEELDCPRWDLTVKSINQFDTPSLHFFKQEGVFVYGVRSGGNAEASGLRPQDIILRVEGKEVGTLDDIREAHKTALDNIRQRSRVLFTVSRNGLMRQVVLDFSRDTTRR